MVVLLRGSAVPKQRNIVAARRWRGRRGRRAWGHGRCAAPLEQGWSGRELLVASFGEKKRGLAWFAACDGKPTERRENRVLASLGWKDRGESSSGRRLPAASLPALLCLRWVREEQQLLICSVERRRAVSKRAPWLAVGKKNQSSWCAVLLLPRGLLSMTERE